MAQTKKIWIARDEGTWDEDGLRQEGRLHAFYDTPVLLKADDGLMRWTNAREIAEIPGYMYPEIADRTCTAFVPETNS